MIDKKIKILNDEVINDLSCKVIEIKNDDEKIRLWIDMVDFIIHRKEHYNKKSKLYKIIEYSNLVVQDKIKFYKNIKTTNLKKKITANLLINEFKVKDYKDSKIFKAPKK